MTVLNDGTTFLETVQSEFHRMKALANGYDGVTHAGLAIVAADTGRVLLAQRAYDETDDPAVRETWEFPGGHLEPGEEPFEAASREFLEEIGFPLPEGEVVDGWRGGPEDNYQCFVYLIPVELNLDGWEGTEEVQSVGWFTRESIEENENLRPEVKNTPWDKVFGAVSGNEGAMTQKCLKCGIVLTWDSQMEEWQAPDGSIGCDEGGSHEVANPGKALTASAEMTDDLMEEPDLSWGDLMGEPLYVHGILAPEEVETGDGRGFNSGSMTARPYRLPFAWQKISVPGHDGSFVVGSVDRMMRKDGMIHWSGALMPTSEAGEFAEYLAFFGRVGVSVDGDKGAMDMARTEATGVLWFEAVRAAGLTAVAIPAFSEAYVAFGRHPEMPDQDSDEYAVLRASGSLVEFDRGPGWVTNPKETKRIHDYWTKKGQPGYAKIRWGTPGDFTRAKKLIGEKIAANSPEDMKYLNQIIAQWHYDALGYWPGELGKPGNAPDTPENRKRAARHAASLTPEFTIETLSSPPADAICLHDDCEAQPTCSVSSDDPLWNGLFCAEHAPEHEDKPLFANMPEGIEHDESGDGWETVLTASAGRVKPPLEYFHRHPDSSGCVIEEPDANGFRRTYGYAAEWGVCHIGYENKCVEPPRMFSDDYPDFHKGRTRVEGGGFIPTGVLTYNVEHRNAQRILTESATQAHFDNLKNAWAAVRIGEDERGIWFSGVVLPKMDEDDLVKIEASGQVSGEWKYGELRALLTVNVEGFAIERASAEYDEDGNVIALAACAHNSTLVASVNGTENAPCTPTPLERMQALALVDAEVRFEALKERWSQ